MSIRKILSLNSCRIVNYYDTVYVIISEYFPQK